MTRFNLSEWSIRNRSVVIYLMIMIMAAGTLTFLHLGRAEDPVFTIRTMVVQAQWPGATLEETLKQVTERLERRLQEVPNLDVLRSYTNAGRTVIFVDLLGSAHGRMVDDTWYDVRKKIGDIRQTLPQGVVGPFFNDEFGDTYGTIYGFTADGFTFRELRDYVENIRSELLKIPDVSKIDVLCAQDEVIFIDFSNEKLASLGLDPSLLVAALQAQNIVRPSGVLRTGDEAISLQVSGAFTSEQDILDVNFSAGGRILRLRDVAEVRRGFADPPQPMFRVNGKPAIGLAIAMREGGDILALGRNLKKAMAQLTADLPVGIQPTLVADQAQIVDHAITDFTSSLWQAIIIVLAVSFVALGVRAGSVVAIAIPLTLAIVFPVMSVVGIDLQRISLGALIIALTLLVDDAMTTIDAMTRRLAAGDPMNVAAVYAYKSARLCDAVGNAGDDRRLRPDRLCAELGRRIHLFDLRGRRDLADRVLVRRGHFRPAPRHAPAEAAAAGARKAAGPALAHLSRLPRWGDPGAVDHLCRDTRRVRAGDRGARPGAAPVFPALRPRRTAGRS